MQNAEADEVSMDQISSISMIEYFRKTSNTKKQALVTIEAATRIGSRNITCSKHV